MAREKLSTKLKNLVYLWTKNKQCYLCDHPSASYLCQYCRAYLELDYCHCTLCSAPTTDNVTRCRHCKTEDHIHRIHCLTPYRGLSKALLLRIKFYQQPHLLRIYAQEFALRLLQSNEEIPTTWYCVPSSSKSLFQRGFQQTNVFAKLLKQELIRQAKDSDQALASLHAIRIHALQQRNKQQQQHHLSRKQRHKRRHTDYKVEAIHASHVVLIDDIITTGSTINACAEALLHAGAQQVDVWALAHTP